MCVVLFMEKHLTSPHLYGGVLDQKAGERFA